MTDPEILQLFLSLMVDMDDFQFLIEHKPLLAHYTSIGVLEKIMKSDEIWFSNPLFMNDLEEVRFGVLEGLRLFTASEAVNNACHTPERTHILRHAFNHFYAQFEAEHAFDTYVFCLSEHDPENTDGLLSMWRGYGGQGNGAALVFNTGFITAPNLNSPLIIARVHYASAEGRKKWLDERITYLMTARGVEPKLRFKIEPLDPMQTWTFASILERIILGPSLSSILARRGVERMLQTVGKSEFRQKISASLIPLRPV
jgi:hypothetical protein